LGSHFVSDRTISNALKLTEKLRKQDGGAYGFSPSMPALYNMQDSKALHNVKRPNQEDCRNIPLAKKADSTRTYLLHNNHTKSSGRIIYFVYENIPFPTRPNLKRSIFSETPFLACAPGNQMARLHSPYSLNPLPPSDAVRKQKKIFKTIFSVQHCHNLKNITHLETRYLII